MAFQAIDPSSILPLDVSRTFGRFGGVAASPDPQPVPLVCAPGDGFLWKTTVFLADMSGPLCGLSAVGLTSVTAAANIYSGVTNKYDVIALGVLALFSLLPGLTGFGQTNDNLTILRAAMSLVGFSYWIYSLVRFSSLIK